MTTIKSIARSGENFIDNHATEILTVVAVMSGISATVTAIRATPTAVKLIEEAQPKDAWETIKVAYKPYIPTAILLGIMVGSVISLHQVGAKRHAALMGLYSLTETTFKNYQKKVVETLGEPKERAIRDEVAKEKVLNNPPQNNIIVTNGGNVLCLDDVSGQYFRSSVTKIDRVMNEINARLISEEFITLNDFYDELGLRQTSLGEYVGFHIDRGLLDVKYTSIYDEKSQEPCVVLKYVVCDKHNNLRYEYD